MKNKKGKRRKSKAERKKAAMKRRYLINAGIFAGIFLAAVVVFSYMTNKENDNIAADLGAAARPQVSFSYNGYEINALPVYAKEMDITAVRGTVTPVANGRLEMQLEPHNNAVTSLTYGVYTLDGEEKLWSNELKDPGKSVTLTFDNTELLSEERVLKLVLGVKGDKGEDEMYLYTRIVDSAGMSTEECLSYIRGFHENALGKVEDAGVGLALEPNEEGDNTTFQHVTINSDYDHVSWGNLEPHVEGSEQYNIMEMNSTYTSALLEYRVRCKGEENDTDVYDVKEFFRVRHVEGGDDYLLDYDRTMEQVFDASHEVLDEQGLILGITDSNFSYMVNKDGTTVSFVQAGELWNYNKEKDEISLVFSFSDAENTDDRNLLPQHSIRILKMEENGNTVFAVYGYMNRGEHEGESGVAVYYYETEKNSVEEKLFIASDKSYERVEEELGELVYYSVEQDRLYVQADGTFYEINAGLQKVKALVAGLSDSEYVVSPDGHLAAWKTAKETEGTDETTADDGRTAGEKNAAVNQGSLKITVKNFASGKERTVECGQDERIIPLGFINEDFVYGISRTADAGRTVAGQEVLPMYTLVIEEETGEIAKQYEQGGMYILGAVLEDNLITLELAEKEGGAYSSTSEDYITNNESTGENKIYAEPYVTELKETQMRLVFEEAPKDGTPKLLKPKQTLQKNFRTVDFMDASSKIKCYVYGYGRLRGSFDSAGEAIREADSCNGVVVSAWQTYIWQRGNRDLKYSIEGKDDEVAQILASLQEGKAPVEIMREISAGKELDLTGCGAEQLLYVVNQDVPVIAMTDAKTAVVIVGYGDGTIAYKDGGRGTKTVSYKEMEEMTKKSGNTYVAYLGK